MCIGSALVKFICQGRYTPESTMSWSLKLIFSNSNLQLKFERLKWSAFYKLNMISIFKEGELVIILKWNIWSTNLPWLERNRPSFAVETENAVTNTMKGYMTMAKGKRDLGHFAGEAQKNSLLK